MLLELGIDDPEIQRIVVTTLIRLRNKHLNDALYGCVLLGSNIHDYSHAVTGPNINVVINGKLGTILHACAKIIVGEYEQAPRRRAHVAAAGCEIYFVPLWPKGKRVTDRKRNRALKLGAAALRGGCSTTANTVRVSLSAHGRGRTMNQLLVGRARTAAVSIAPRGKKKTPGSHLTVSWSAPA